MIEEVDSNQYIQHYFEKVYKELDHSPESFLRAALEFAHRQGGLLSQPGAMESLTRLAQGIAGGDSPASSPDTGDAPGAAPARDVTTAAAAEPTSAPEPTPSVDMPDASPVAGPSDENPVEEAQSSGPVVNAGNGADLGTYSWTQTLAEVVINIPVPSGTRGRDCDVSISRTRLRAGLKGAQPVLDGPMPAPVKAEDCLWTLEGGATPHLEITLAKTDALVWWKSVVEGQPEIDTAKVEPEASKLSDLDGEMRATVEKMMFDQRQKALGLPTSEETAKQEAYKRFMDAHPELDFSGAKFM